ncbi:MAG: hypothetical protein Q7S78_00710 [Candidatus Azambacteria bacterium]|nr:hypothetical protein [Candidatus Azambacteria bacterium]
MKKHIFLVLGALAGIGFMGNPAFAIVKSDDTITIAANDLWSASVQSTDILRLAARIDYNKPAGANPTIEIYVNDKPLVSPLLNKGSKFTYKDGRTFSYQSGNAWLLFYNPDFSANNSSAGGGYQVMTDPGQAYLYKWDISSLVGGAKSMKLAIKNNGKAIGKPIVVTLLSKYPIAALGNCESEDSCRGYCGKQENYAVCADYGQKNNIISEEDAERAKEFADVLKGEGPGGCKDEKSCKGYCEGATHLDECLSFAEKHNFIAGDQLAEARKISKALKDGATLPGGCTDKATCDTYCKVSTHVEECLGFAKKAGFISEQEAVEAEKVLPFIKSGQTPGGCTTKTDCQKYCDNSNNNSECTDFAEKAGFMNKEEADMARKTGGKGPGNCKSKDSCEQYCNKKDNQKECFGFAQKYNLIPADKLKEIQDGMGRLRSGLDQMPSEAMACLKDNLGESVIGDIQSGNFAPGPQTGEIIKGCFDKIMPKLQAKLQQGLSQATPEALACLKNGMGEGEFEKVKSGEAPSPENGDIFRKCFESMKTEGVKKLKEGLNKMPPEIRTCVEGKLGDVSEKIQSGELKGEEDIKGVIQECASSFKPQGIPKGMPSGMPPTDMGDATPSSGAMPAVDCSAFAAAPSCSYVPESARAICEKCKAE